MAEYIVEKYNVPGIGRVDLVHNPENKKNGPYYARVEGHGLGATRSQTEERARLNVGMELKWVLEREKKELEKKLDPINETLSKMSLQLNSLNLLNSFEIKE